MGQDLSRPSLPSQRLIVELGPGHSRHLDGALTIDHSFNAAVDIIADLEEGLGFLSDESVDEIHGYHVLEHVYALAHLVSECWRVLRPGGLLVGSVPHFSNPYFYSDPTHHRSFGLYTFAYFCAAPELVREVPRYFPVDFRCRELRYGFRSPFSHRNRIKRLVERMVNHNSWIKEFYEENLCFLMPAYELHFVLEKNR